MNNFMYRYIIIFSFLCSVAVAQERSAVSINKGSNPKDLNASAGVVADAVNRYNEVKKKTENIKLLVTEIEKTAGGVGTCVGADVEPAPAPETPAEIEKNSAKWVLVDPKLCIPMDQNTSSFACASSVREGMSCEEKGESCVTFAGEGDNSAGCVPMYQFHLYECR